MRDFARLSGSDRAALFAEAAARSGLPLVIIEKDFWVCWLLQRLWDSPFAPHLIFKGGTSLSKCFGLIGRFSEDIDIGLDRAFLGFDGDNDPAAEGLSSNQRNKRVEKLKAAAKQWIQTDFLAGLTANIRAEIGESGWSFGTLHDSDGMPQLRWNPPLSQVKRGKTVVADSYLNRGVLLEVGSRAAHWPASRHDISSYVAQQIPEAFTTPTASICALEVARTFWEKATILHVLHHETQNDLAAGKLVRERERVSRHCYDLHCIAQSKVGNDAISNFDLLADVVRFKRVFFCSSLAKEKLYDDARPGTFRLTPHSALEKFFAADYAKMLKSRMFFGTAPSWSEIRQTLQDVEKHINANEPNEPAA